MLRAALRSLLQHKLRLTLTVLAILVGVAFVAGTYIFTDSLQRSFDALFTVPRPDVSVQVSSPFAGVGGGGGSGSDAGDQAPTLPEALVGTVSAVDGVAAAYGTVLADGAVVIGTDGTVVGQAGPPARGTAFVPDTAISPLTVVAGRAPSGPGEVALLEATATAAGVGIGDPVRIDTPAGPVRPTVVGLVSRGVAGSDGSTLAVWDLPTAQRLLLGRSDRITGVAVRADAGVSQDQLAQRIQAVLPANAKTQTGDQRAAELAQRLQDTFRFVNIFLLVFALIALFVASFLIFNTFSMLVAQRTRELALLRAVGATRAQVRRSVLVEAAAVGAVASALGLVGGIGVSRLLSWLFSRFGASLPPGPLVIETRTVVVAFAVGLTVTLVSAYVPARRAAVVPPVAAMRDDVALPVRSLRVRTVVGLVLLAAAVVLARRGITLSADPASTERAAALVGLSALCALVATIGLAPVVGRGVLRVLAAPFSRTPVGRLARENGRRNPRRTAATASALAIGLALMTAVGVIAASAKASVAAVVDNTIGADFIVLGAKFQPFTPQVYGAVRGTPGTSTVTYVRTIPVQVDGSTELVAGVDPEAFGQVFDLQMDSGSLSDLSLGSALLDSTAAKDLGVHVGDTVHGQFVNGPSALRVVGIYTPAGFVQGFITTLSTVQTIGSRELDAAVYVRDSPGADPAGVRAELTRRLEPFPSVQLSSQADLKDEVDAQFDRVFGFVYALLFLAVAVAFLGIVNTLALSVHERIREVGLLRAVGTSRRQVRRMVVLESVLIALFGAAVGMVLGLVYGALLQKVLQSQGISELAVPGGQLALFAAMSAVGGLLAALWPAFTASRLNVLRAIATE